MLKSSSSSSKYQILKCEDKGKGDVGSEATWDQCFKKGCFFFQSALHAKAKKSAFHGSHALRLCAFDNYGSIFQDIHPYTSVHFVTIQRSLIHSDLTYVAAQN